MIEDKTFTIIIHNTKSMKTTIQICLLIVICFHPSIQGQNSNSSSHCVFKAFKTGQFSELFLYTGDTESAYTQSVEVMVNPGLDYKGVFRSVNNAGMKIDHQVKRKGTKEFATLTVVTDTIQEKQFRKVFYLQDKKYKKSKVKSECAHIQNQAIINEVASKLRKLNYYTGPQPSIWSDELMNGLMLFQLHNKVPLGALSDVTLELLEINAAEFVIDTSPSMLRSIDSAKKNSVEIDSTWLNSDVPRSNFPLLFDSLNMEILDSIHIDNASFEEIPRVGGQFGIMNVTGWFDCGQIYFRSESPPDIHPTENKSWGVSKSAIHGNTYIGMVVRDNQSWESVSQKLATPLKKGKCYAISAYLSQSENYNSRSRSNNKMANYNSPSQLKVYGGMGTCHKAQLFAVSEPVNSDTWKEHVFHFVPQEEYTQITLLVQLPNLIHGNGHLLLDGMSQIYEVKCE